MDFLHHSGVHQLAGGYANRKQLFYKLKQSPRAWFDSLVQPCGLLDTGPA